MSSRQARSRTELEQQGRAIVERLGGRWANGGGMCKCPSHDDSSPSLSIRTGDRSLFFHCFSGCETVDVMRALRRSGQVGREGVLSTEEPAKPKSGNLDALLEKVWNGAQPIGGTAAEEYLASRGITVSSNQLRFHPRVQLGSKAEASYHRAMLAALRDGTGRLIALHRTFLAPAKPTKAAFENPKRLLGYPGKGAVRLAAAGEVLGLAEGIETALAARMVYNIPVWAVLGNERFGMIDIPTTVKRIVILADNDAGGKRAAKLARDGLGGKGIELQELWPMNDCNDWADIVACKGGEGAVSG